MAKLPSRGLATLAVLLASALCQASERIVVLTSDVADIVVALGAAPQVVGRDRLVEAFARNALVAPSGTGTCPGNRLCPLAECRADCAAQAHPGAGQ